MNSTIGKPPSAAGGGGRTATVTSGGPVVKVSSSTPVIHQLDGSVTLVVTSSSSSALSPSPNVSVTSTPLVPGSGKKLTGSRIHTPKERKNDIGSKEPFSSKGSKESKEVTLKGDLRNIMHAFGDGSSPAEDSVHVMELILRQEMESFIFICDSAAYWSGSKILGLRECIYVLRNDRVFLARLFKYLVFKDQQHKITRVNQGNQQKAVPQSKNYVAEIRAVLEELDTYGDLECLLDPDNNPESSKPEKAHTADVNYYRLTSPKYINYARARSVSFARKLSQLQEWVSLHMHSEYKLSQNFMEVLGFLIYEMVAQIVDLSFIIKRERMSSYNPIHKMWDPRGSNPDTCMSASAFQKRKDEEECNNVSEILVLASEIEAKRLKKVTVPNREALVTRGVHCLSPAEIREAYIRMQSSHPPSVSFRTRAEKIRQLNFQY